jgi:hypothetical protein
VCSLGSLLLDSYYRTMKGFMVRICSIEPSDFFTQGMLGSSQRHFYTKVMQLIDSARQLTLHRAAAVKDSLGPPCLLLQQRTCRLTDPYLCDRFLAKYF